MIVIVGAVLICSFHAAPLVLMVLNSLQRGDNCLMQTSVSVFWLKKNTIVKETAKRGCSRFITNQSKFIGCEHKLTVLFFRGKKSFSMWRGKLPQHNKAQKTYKHASSLWALFSLTCTKKTMIWRRSENRKCRNEFIKTALKTFLLSCLLTQLHQLTLSPC